MKCPNCFAHNSKVLKTERPLDEGMEFGRLKRRRRQCKECRRSFFTFEIHEDVFRKMLVLMEGVVPALPTRRSLRTKKNPPEPPSLRRTHV